ncbi:MAG TPA: hypothetical protein VFX30_14265 [bacterium]|nr:hypothetical protein [bacterium]
MIGVLSPQILPVPASPRVASVLAAADRSFAGLAEDFFRPLRSQGYAAEVSTEDRFVRAVVPLRGEEDPHYFLTNLGNVQGLLQGKVRLVSLESKGEDVVARLGFPFPSVLVGLLTFLYGAQAMTPVFLSREVERDEVNRMYARNEQPVGVFDHPRYLSHMKDLVHGFIFMFHDLYHLAFGSALPLHLRLMWANLYDRINGLPDPIRRLTVAERLLDTLTDNDIDARLVESEEILAFIPFRGIMERFQEASRSDDGEDAFEIYRECETFLNGFLACLGRADDPALLHTDFLMRNLRDMHRIAGTQAALRSALGGGFF